jgi:hypothetical protein
VTRDARDYVVLAGLSSPGFVRLTGHDRASEWDVKQAKGQTGASTVYNGKSVGEFQASFYLVDDDDVAEWEVFQRLLDATTAGPSPFALTIYHPDLARNRLTEVTAKSVGGLTYDGRGGALVQVVFLEYLPPKPKPSASATPRKAPPSAGSGSARPDPNAAAKRELASLLAKAGAP